MVHTDDLLPNAQNIDANRQMYYREEFVLEINAKCRENEMLTYRSTKWGAAEIKLHNGSDLIVSAQRLAHKSLCGRYEN